MSTHASPAQGREIDGWPQADAEGRPVLFTSRDPRPRPDEYEPVLKGPVPRRRWQRTRAALLRIGAVQEGAFRSHVITAEGRIRHSVYFSITADEWPAVKVRLEEMLARSR